MTTSARRAPLDLQEHLQRLDAMGLLTKVQIPIDKDSELHPLARWQFQGGLPDDQRRGFVFTDVKGAKGEKYDIPVAVGVLAASPAIYAAGLGVAEEEIGDVWVNAMENPIAPVTVEDAPCQEVVITGDELRQEGKGLGSLPVPVSTPGFDSAPYFTATLCVTRDPENGIRNMGTYRAALKAEDRLGVRMASRLSRRRRLSALAEISENGRADALRHRHRLRTGGPVHRAAETADRPGRTGRGRRADGRADADRASCKTIDLEVPADAEIVIEGLIDTDAAGAGGSVRRKPRPRRAGRLQHVDAGDGDHPQEEAGARLDRRAGDAERIQRAEARGLRAAVPRTT